jgi:hypothetical protein
VFESSAAETRGLATENASEDESSLDNFVDDLVKELVTNATTVDAPTAERSFARAEAPVSETPAAEERELTAENASEDESPLDNFVEDLVKEFVANATTADAPAAERSLVQAEAPVEENAPDAHTSEPLPGETQTPAGENSPESAQAPTAETVSEEEEEMPNGKDGPDAEIPENAPLPSDCDSAPGSMPPATPALTLLPIDLGTDLIEAFIDSVQTEAPADASAAPRDANPISDSPPEAAHATAELPDDFEAPPDAGPGAEPESGSGFVDRFLAAPAADSEAALPRDRPEIAAVLVHSDSVTVEVGSQHATARSWEDSAEISVESGFIARFLGPSSVDATAVHDEKANSVDGTEADSRGIERPASPVSVLTISDPNVLAQRDAGGEGAERELSGVWSVESVRGRVAGELDTRSPVRPRPEPRNPDPVPSAGIAPTGGEADLSSGLVNDAEPELEPSFPGDGVPGESTFAAAPEHLPGESHDLSVEAEAP